MKEKLPLVNREISWLYFNERVLQEAEDTSVPLIERLRFLGIFSSNLDEFYRVRVATLNRLIGLSSSKTKDVLGFNPKKILNEIKQLVVLQEQRFDFLYEKVIIPQLEENKIFIINEKQLNVERGAFVRQYFRKEVLPYLVPIMLDFDSNSKFPELSDQRIYLYVKLTFKKKAKYALVQVPPKLSRFLVLPENRGMKFIILLDDIIRYCLDDVFFLFDFDQIEAYSIQLTRDAELDVDVKLPHKFIEALEKSLLQRGKGRPMRLLYDSDAPLDFIELIKQQVGVDTDGLIPSGRYHNFKDFIKFPSIGDENLLNEILPPLRLKHLQLGTSLINQIEKKDVLVHLPYQSFNYIIHFLREAAIDPKVQDIWICLYRLAENSNVINALINAAKNGKKVFCMIELKARFDEEANIFWMNKLVEGGVQVSIGLTEFKIHAKVCLISRMEKKKLNYYANLATGNFNEKTASLYADHSLFTSNPLITSDLLRMFEGLAEKVFLKEYTSLICSPTEMRGKLYALIDQEIAAKNEGKNAHIFMKMNSLTDEEMIAKLYEASNAGVKVQLIVRGMCSLIPGLEGWSENIEVRSIVDRFLEHARVWVFANQGDEKVYLSSADLMTRNIDHRLEVAFPLLDPDVKKEIIDILQIQWKDNTKARIINEKQDNSYFGANQKVKNRAQIDIYNYLKYKVK